MIASGALPVLVIAIAALTVVAVGTFPNASGVGESEMAGATPLPESAIPWGLPKALVSICTEPRRAPVAVGLNKTESVHVLPGARLGTAHPLTLKSPEAVMLSKASAPLPSFLSVKA